MPLFCVCGGNCDVFRQTDRKESTYTCSYYVVPQMDMDVHATLQGHMHVHVHVVCVRYVYGELDTAESSRNYLHVKLREYSMIA